MGGSMNLFSLAWSDLRCISFRGSKQNGLKKKMAIRHRRWFCLFLVFCPPAPQVVCLCSLIGWIAAQGSWLCAAGWRWACPRTQQRTVGWCSVGLLNLAMMSRVVQRGKTRNQHVHTGDRGSVYWCRISFDCLMERLGHNSWVNFIWFCQNKSL